MLFSVFMTTGLFTYLNKKILTRMLFPITICERGRERSWWSWWPQDFEIFMSYVAFIHHFILVMIFSKQTQNKLVWDCFYYIFTTTFTVVRSIIILISWNVCTKGIWASCVFPPKPEFLGFLWLLFVFEAQNENIFQRETIIYLTKVRVVLKQNLESSKRNQ